MATAIEQLAMWVQAFRSRRPSDEAISQAKQVLLDSLGCILAARSDDTVRLVLEVIREAGGAKQARILGTGERSSAANAVFANGVLIRVLDFNDFTGGSRIDGHPSDNITVALTIGDWQQSSGHDALLAIVMAYELYCRLQDQIDRSSPWDHVTASGIVAPAIAGFLMNLDLKRLSHALALSAVHCPTLGAVRKGHLSSAKGIANATVAQAAVFQTLLAARGLTGPLQVLEGSRGLGANVLLQGGISEILAPTGERYRIMDAHLKAFPCLGTAQSLVAAALAIRPRIEKSLDDIEAIEITMADLPVIASQIADPARRHPSSREAADHSFYFLPVVALLDGKLGARQFEDCRWEDRRVKAVMDRVTIRMDKDLNQRAPASFPARLQVTMRSGQIHAAEVPYPPGHPKNRLTMEGIVGKFTRYMDAKNQEIDWVRLVRAIETLDSAPDLDGLLKTLCAGQVCG